jgi:hypothetical protein
MGKQSLSGFARVGLSSPFAVLQAISGWQEACRGLRGPQSRRISNLKHRHANVMMA